MNPQCARCGSRRSYLERRKMDTVKGLFVGMTLIGLPLMPKYLFEKRRRCADCGSTRFYSVR